MDGRVKPGHDGRGKGTARRLLLSAFVLAAGLLSLATPALAQTAGSSTLPQASSGSGTTVTASGVEVGTLATVTPDYGGTLDEGAGGFPMDMWKGTDRALVEKLLPMLPAAPSSPAMRDLARRLLLTNAVAPAGKSTVDLFGARADRLAAMGDFADAAALLALQPAPDAGPASARLRINALLLAGDDDGACKAVDATKAKASADIDWQKALIFCQLHAGKTDEAALGLDVLHDQDPKDEAFYKLARAMGGDKSVKVASLPDPTPLELAMLHAAALPLPPDAAGASDPAVLLAMAGDASIPPATALAAEEQAAAAGALPVSKLQAAYASVSFPPEDLAAAVAVSEKDGGATGRALLFQAAGLNQDLPGRIHIVQAALDRARRQGGYLLSVQANLPYILPLTPSADLSWFAGDAGRALYASGHYEQANAWLQIAQDRAKTDAAAAGAAATLAVYARIAGVGQPLFWDAAAVQKWRQGQAAGPASAAAINRLFAVFEGLGEPIGGAWTLIGQDTTAGAAPDPALWFDLGDAANNGRIGETVLLSLCAIGPGGPAGANPIMLSRAISSLRQVGLDAEARTIAIEAAIAAGV